MFNTKLGSKGFTLIELLVVISIIGLLSSVVLASLNTARAKAKDAAIKSTVLQFRNLFELEYSDTGSYAGLKPSGDPWYPLIQCDADFGTSKYRDQARQMCKNLIKEASNNYWLLLGGAIADKYSICATLTGAASPNYCVGSSGISDGVSWAYIPPSVTMPPDWWASPNPSWSNLPIGSYYNP